MKNSFNSPLKKNTFSVLAPPFTDDLCRLCRAARTRPREFNVVSRQTRYHSRILIHKTYGFNHRNLEKSDESENCVLSRSKLYCFYILPTTRGQTISHRCRTYNIIIRLLQQLDKTTFVFGKTAIVYPHGRTAVWCVQQ